MGLALSILYFVTAYLGPTTLFGSLAEYHVEVLVAAAALLVSLPLLQRSLIWKTPQSLALIGLSFAVFMSLFVTGWAGGAAQVFIDFIPNAFAFYLVGLNCNSKRKLQILILAMLGVCLFVIANGYFDLQHAASWSGTANEKPVETPYLLAQMSDSGAWFYRIRGLDFISDPNDLAQVIVVVLPLLFIFWRPKKTFRNIALLILPVSALLFGAFLTHSRGSLLAIVAMILVVGRRKIGTIPSLILAVGLFIGMSASNYTGGREISAQSGTDRMDLWADGLHLLETHPVFGVGYNQMPQYTDSGLTAHNTVVVCAAELGLFGLYFWSMFLFTSVGNTLVVASSEKVTDPVPVAAAKTPFLQPMRKQTPIDKAEINHLGRIVTASITGFLVTGWFLSRAFTMTFFVLGGIAEVVYAMALQRGMVAPRMATSRVLRYSGALTFGLIILVYVVLRFGNLMR